MFELTPAYRVLVETTCRQHEVTDSHSLFACRHVASRLQSARQDVRDLASLNMLDLGCGSEKSKDHPSLFEWLRSGCRKIDTCKPWYCRMARLAGANVLGIDLASNKRESFPSLQADLVDPDTLNQLEDESFDAVNNNLYTTHGNDRLGHLPFSPHLQRQLGYKEILLDEYQAYLQDQVQRLLKEGGRYTLNRAVYEKQKGKLAVVGGVWED